MSFNRSRWLVVTAVLAVASLPRGTRATPLGSGATDASVAVTIEGITSAAPVRAAFVLPGATLPLEVSGKGPIRVRVSQGRVTSPGPARWVWHAPARPGLYPLTVVTAAGDSIRVNAFVLVPFDSVRRDASNGFRLGHYPAKPYRGLDIYRRPSGFVEVTPANRHTLVAPHFRLEQFLSRQWDEYPMYVVLDPALLQKLERIVAGLRDRGHAVETLVVTSGYRTPEQNRTTRNSIIHSRHLWGAAADVLVDEEPRDGVMDDLNGDGRIDEHDVEVIGQIADAIDADTGVRALWGGRHAYRATPGHGPFLHVDVRGFRTRW